MSQPKRYDCGMTEESSPSGIINRWPLMHSHPSGKYVLHSDYAALAAENERLRGKIEAMRIAGDIVEARRYIVDRCKHSTESDGWERAKKGLPSRAQQWEREKANRLAAENERLRKAGDDVISKIEVCSENLWCAIHRWNAAKEGRDAK